MSTQHCLQIKRVYDPPEEKDGFRVLVDRLWPRGLKKEPAYIDVWMKEIAPSPTLRKWFNHTPEKWDQFSREYEQELKQAKAGKTLLVYIRSHKKTTLLYAARDNAHTHALILQHFIHQLLNPSP